MTDLTENRILYALYCLSRDTRHISAQTLARAAEVTPTHAARALVALEAAGLVDASRARLTMLGLAKAVSAGADLGGQGIQVEAEEAVVPEAPLPVAALPSDAPPAPEAEPHPRH